MKQEDANANVRTLIVSFVVAVFALIPLRFYEAAQTMPGVETQVLGARTEVILPKVSAVQEEKQMLLEAPYDEIEAGSQAVTSKQVLGATSQCVSSSEMNEILKDASGTTGLSEDDKVMLLDEISNLRVCE